MRQLPEVKAEAAPFPCLAEGTERCDSDSWELLRGPQLNVPKPKVWRGRLRAGGSASDAGIPAEANRQGIREKGLPRMWGE